MIDICVLHTGYSLGEKIGESSNKKCSTSAAITASSISREKQTAVVIAEEECKPCFISYVAELSEFESILPGLAQCDSYKTNWIVRLTVSNHAQAVHVESRLKSISTKGLNCLKNLCDSTKSSH